MPTRIASALLLLFFIQCKSDINSAKTEEASTEKAPTAKSKTLEKPIIAATFFDTLPFKSIHRKYENPLCLNMTMDSIYNNDLHAFTLIDLRSNEIILHAHPMNNGYLIEKTNDSTYIISMKTSLPQNGDWDAKGFKKYIIAKYEIKITENEYSISLVDEMNEIPFNKNLIRPILQQLDKHNNDPKSQRFIGKDIRKQKELLEYTLFADLLSDNREMERIYFDILDKYSFGGQFREYLIGNTIALYSLGKISPDSKIRNQLKLAWYYNTIGECE